MNKKNLKLFFLLGLLTSLMAPSIGLAKDKYISVRNDGDDSAYFKGSPPKTKHNVFFGVGFNFFDALGVQTRYANQIVRDGFLPGINDSLYLEFGFGITFYGNRAAKSNVTGFSPVATLRWDLHFDEDWIFFGTFGFGYNFITKVSSVKDVTGGGIFPAIGVGATYNINQDWGIRADLGYQFFGLGGIYRF